MAKASCITVPARSSETPIYFERGSILTLSPTTDHRHLCRVKCSAFSQIFKILSFGFLRRCFLRAGRYCIGDELFKMEATLESASQRRFFSHPSEECTDNREGSPRNNLEADRASIWTEPRVPTRRCCRPNSPCGINGTNRVDFIHS